MSLIPNTVPLTGTIAPIDSADDYPVTDAKYGLDGHRSVLSNAERDEITARRRKWGMTVYVQSTGVTYRLGQDLSNASWSVVSFDNPDVSDLVNATQVNEAMTSRLEPYYNKTQVDAKIAPLAVKSEVDAAFVTIGEQVSAVTAAIPDVSDFATHSEVTAAIPDVSNFATHSEVTAAIPDVSNFATHSEVTAAIPDVSNFATHDEVSAVQAAIPDVSNFATNSQLSAVQTDLQTGADSYFTEFLGIVGGHKSSFDIVMWSTGIVTYGDSVNSNLFTVIPNIANRVFNLEIGFSSHDSAISGMLTRLDAIEARLDTIEARLTTAGIS